MFVVKWRLSILSMFLFLLCFSSVDLWGEEIADDTVKSITAVHINSNSKIDGILDEDFWQKVPRSGDFIQYQPDEGKPASESTFVRVAYDDKALYVGMEMFDSEPDKIINRLTRRDRSVEADIAHVIIDSHHDHQTAYAFSVYASGTQKDTYYYNDNWSDESWDAVWDVAARITDWGWVAEYRIPFQCLRFASEENPVWGFYCSRNISRKNELGRWIYIPEKANGFVSYFGHLKGLKNITPPKRLEILPYLVSYENTEPKSLGNPDGRDFFGNLGLDLKYGITSNITLDATVNPDFGQVEADETILNLSVFETSYPEKRPFFLEGFKIFETPFDLFYSRRIGKSPSLWPDDVDHYLNRPNATSILFAGKVSGKTSGGTSIGVLEAVTQKEEAEFIDEDGYRRKEVVEPEANYFIARVMQDVLKNSTIGVMATAVNQKSSYPAYTGGVDWTLRLRNGDYQTAGHLIGSKNNDDNGWGMWMRLGKDGGEYIRGAVEGLYLDRGLNINHLGFLNHDDFRQIYGWLQYRTTKNWWIIRKTWHNLNIELADNLSGLKMTRGGNYNFQIELTNFWYLGGGIWADFDNIYSPWETRAGPPAPIPVGQNWWIWFNTDSRKWWQVNPFIEGGDNWDGHYISYSLGLNFQPRSNLEFSLAPGYTHKKGISRWLTYLEDVEGNRTDDIFGEQEVEQFNMTIRGTFTFTKNLTLQVYAQPFFAAVDYKNFKKLVPPDNFEYVDSTVYNERIEQPDFKWTSFNSNVVLRWEYRPGSTLFLVWTQSRETYDSGIGNLKLFGDAYYQGDLKYLFDTVPNNVFLIKLNYWWSL
ncbi:MAG: carbohydrate binding family 9 domain-containing protein [candidate division Zixibacteria bacterium]|nr:carbohydrate binding family 9 domain-containing protein [candidate division Zixibacteria bacterium]